MKKNMMSINYNEKLIVDLNLIEGENANFLQQRDMFIRENQSLKEQLAQLEDKLYELNSPKVLNVNDSQLSNNQTHDINFNSGSFGKPSGP